MVAAKRPVPSPRPPPALPACPRRPRPPGQSPIKRAVELFAQCSWDEGCSWVSKRWRRCNSCRKTHCDGVAARGQGMVRGEPGAAGTPERSSRGLRGPHPARPALPGAALARAAVRLARTARWRLAGRIETRGTACAGVPRHSIDCGHWPGDRATPGPRRRVGDGATNVPPGGPIMHSELSLRSPACGASPFSRQQPSCDRQPGMQCVCTLPLPPPLVPRPLLTPPMLPGVSAREVPIQSAYPPRCLPWAHWARAYASVRTHSRARIFTHAFAHSRTRTRAHALALQICSRKAENVEKTVQELKAENINVHGIPCHVVRPKP